MNFNATLIGQIFSFFGFVWCTKTYVWPLLLKQMQDRETRIADGLAAADKGQQALVEAEMKRAELVEQGKHQAADIVNQAQKRGDEIFEESKIGAKAEAERLIHGAQAEIERERSQARENLKREVAVLALAGVEQILLREVDRNKHNDILAKVSSEL